MLKYSQSSGTWSSTDGSALAHGWSGNHAGKDNPEMQDKPCIGPLPRGTYTICPWEEHHDHLGPMVAFLKPDAVNVMFGRGDFFIHGPSSVIYGQESKGCIVTPHADRKMIKDTGETRLEVVA